MVQEGEADIVSGMFCDGSGCVCRVLCLSYFSLGLFGFLFGTVYLFILVRYDCLFSFFSCPCSGQFTFVFFFFSVRNRTVHDQWAVVDGDDDGVDYRRFGTGVLLRLYVCTV